MMKHEKCVKLTHHSESIPSGFFVFVANLNLRLKVVISWKVSWIHLHNLPLWRGDWCASLKSSPLISILSELIRKKPKLRSYAHNMHAMYVYMRLKQRQIRQDNFLPENLKKFFPQMQTTFSYVLRCKCNHFFKSILVSQVIQSVLLHMQFALCTWQFTQNLNLQSQNNQLTN